MCGIAGMLIANDDLPAGAQGRLARTLRRLFGTDWDLVVGNVATAAGTQRLIDAGADAVKFQKRTPALCVPEAQKSQPKSEQEQKVIGLLKGDPQMRTAFMNKVAGPIARSSMSLGTTW